MKQKTILYLLILCLFYAIPCKSAAGWSEIAPGVLWYEATANGAKGPIRIWFYLPTKRSGKIPCVIVPPAGTRLFHGMSLGEGDRKEHYPYVRAGFAVVSFDIEGPLPDDDPSMLKAAAAARIFMAAKGGVVDGQAAINSIASIKDIDPAKVFVAGHSSAGTTALALAAADKRVKACAAFAPCADVVAFLGTDMTLFNSLVPGFQNFIQSFSPSQNTASLTCPVLIFNAADDDNITPAQVSSYVNLLKKTNNHLSTVTVPSGGHYDSMIQYGIPNAMKFFRTP